MTTHELQVNLHWQVPVFRLLISSLWQHQISHQLNTSRESIMDFQVLFSTQSFKYEFSGSSVSPFKPWRQRNRFYQFMIMSDIHISRLHYVLHVKWFSENHFNVDSDQVDTHIYCTKLKLLRHFEHNLGLTLGWKIHQVDPRDSILFVNAIR